MNYNQLKTDVAAVIRTNGNEEITGEVLQYILLQMIGVLGNQFQFAGVGTAETEVGTPDENKAWLVGSGHYSNFGTAFDVAENELGVVLYNGAFVVRKVTIGRPVDSQITPNGTNPVAGGAIAAEFAQLRAAGYLFVGLAVPATEPPAERPEKIFYIAAEGGTYANFGATVVPMGLSILKWNGSAWVLEIIWRVDDAPTELSNNLVLSGGVMAHLQDKVDKVPDMGLSQNSYSNHDKAKLDALPTAQEIASMLDLKQNVLTFDNQPTQGSLNPVTSNGINEAIKDFITKAVDDLVNYYTKGETYTRAQVDQMIAAIKQFNILAVPVLPEASAETVGTLYLVPSQEPGTQNVKDEYITLSKSEGGVVTYYWECIGRTEVDLSNYPTFDQMNAAIAAALAAYYTSAQVDTLIATLTGNLADIEVVVDKDTILTDTAVTINIVGRSQMTAESLVLSRGGVTIASGTGKAVTGQENVDAPVSGTLTYLLTAVIGGVTRTKEVVVEVMDAVYYGAGTQATDITTKATARRSAGGRYSIVASQDDYFFILVPQGMTIQGMKMSGLDIPVETPTGVIIDGLTYLCYQSSNQYDAGSYTIEVY